MENKKIGVGIAVLVLMTILLTVMLIFGLKSETTYKVIFDSNNNGSKQTVEVKKDNTISKPNDPVREGYIFEGWYYNGEKFDFTIKIDKDITLEAKWSSIVVSKWVVTFDSNGGSKVSSITIEDKKVINKVPTPTREGYIFEGWYYNNQEFDFDSAITKNITLTAKWKKIEKPVSGEVSTIKYSVKFNSNGGTTVKSQTVEKYKTAIKPSDPVRAGYTFAGWYNGDVLYNFSSRVTQNITLTAKWEKVVSKYTVTFKDGKDTLSTQTVEEGKIATNPVNPTKEGYGFMGWYNGNVKFDFDTEINANVTLTAKWIGYEIIDVPNSTAHQAKLYIVLEYGTDEGERKTVRVKGTIDKTNEDNETVTKTVNVDGLDIIKGMHKYSNPKVID